MKDVGGRGTNQSEFHWHWCMQGGFGELDVEHARSFHESLPRCPCKAIPADMPFVRLTWLLDPVTDLRNLPRLQDLPPQALVYPEEMSATYFISHRWLATDHPDRSGEQVSVALARTWAPNLASPQARAHRAGVWYDWLCLPQAPRTAADEATLERLLPCVYLLPAVSHPLVVLSANSLLASRAWCVAEAVSAFLNGRHWEAVSLSMLTTQYGTLVTGERPIGELLERKYVGREPGLLKLAAWIRQADSLHFEPAAAESRLLQEGANWKHCVDVVNQVAIDLRMMMGRAGVDDIAPDRLLHLADDMKLETTVPRDRLPCMQAMARAVRGWRDVARG